MQLVACAAAVAGPQQILLLDEPTSNLSPEAISAFSEVLQRLKIAGWTLVVAEHRVYPLKGLADQVAIMDKGRIQHLYTADKFFNLSPKQRKELGLRTLEKPEMYVNTTPDQQADGITAKNLKFSYGKRRVLSITSLC